MFCVCVSELEFRRVQIKSDFGSENDFLPRSVNHERKQFLAQRLKFDFEFVVLGQLLVLQVQVLQFQSEFLHICILVHFVLVEDRHSARVVVTFYHNVDFFGFDFPFFHLRRFLVGQVPQLLQGQFLHNVELDPRGEGVETVPFFLHFEQHNSFLVGIHFDGKLVAVLSLLGNLNEFVVLQSDRLAQIL